MRFDLHRFGHRVLLYVAIVAVVQVTLELMLLASAGPYAHGAVGALYIAIMVNFAILIDNPFAVKPNLIVGSWGWNVYFMTEVLMGSFFMFLIALALGEIISLLRIRRSS